MEEQFPAPVIKIAKETGDVRVHTFIGSERFFAVATHVIEGPNELVVVDGQLVVWYAKEFRAYIDQLNKPISRTYLSHDHPDHFFGLSAAFGDKPMYALPETIRSLEENGETVRKAQYERFGPGVPEFVVIPTFAVNPGIEIIDGIRFVFERVTDAEVAHQLVIKLPEHKICILQDLLYNGVHLCIENKEITNWIRYLEELLVSDYELFLPGHGEPADKNEVEENIRYIKTALDLAEKHTGDIENYKTALFESFPNRKAPQLVHIGAPRLFGGSH